MIVSLFFGHTTLCVLCEDFSLKRKTAPEGADEVSVKSNLT